MIGGSAILQSKSWRDWRSSKPWCMGGWMYTTCVSKLLDNIFKYPTMQEMVDMVRAYNENSKGDRNPDSHLAGILFESKDHHVTITLHFSTISIIRTPTSQRSSYVSLRRTSLILLRSLQQPCLLCWCHLMPKQSKPSTKNLNFLEFN
jgi:hypothetical protein